MEANVAADFAYSANVILLLMCLSTVYFIFGGCHAIFALSKAIQEKYPISLKVIYTILFTIFFSPVLLASLTGRGECSCLFYFTIFLSFAVYAAGKIFAGSKEGEQRKECFSLLSYQEVATGNFQEESKKNNH